jgi:lycopene cyclase domain-containing protein
VYTYLLLDLFSFLAPLAVSFDSRNPFYRRVPALLPGLILTGSAFIIWDVIFTEKGVWGFNSRYLVGIDILNLPIEEWLFFIVIPYACVFTYEVFKYFFGVEKWEIPGRAISVFLIGFLITVSLFNLDKAYTSITFISLAVFLLIHLVFIRQGYLGLFFLSYCGIMIPFLLVNGILTGSFIEEEVVWYNNNENLGIRIFTIPVEDVFYGMLLILMNVTFFEYFLRKFKIRF